jgi:TIGR02453 family protein
MLQTSTLKFLKDLKKNNNKSWFDANRKRYDEAKKDFELFIQQVIDLHGKKDKTISSLKAKECLFRINRDIRFSKDKTPYKTNFGASINKGGKKAFSTAGYYFHLEPGEAFVGGGIYQPMPEELRKVRQEIDYNFKEFKNIIGSKKFKSVYGDLDKSNEFLLSRVPKGYEADNPAADYLRLKSYIAFEHITDSDLTSKTLVKKAADAFQTLQPFIDFVNGSLS